MEIFHKTFLIAALLCLTVYGTNAHADYDTGKEAYDIRDYATALKELIPLAKNGHARAQQIVGQMYRHGNGVEANMVTGTTWIHKSAEQGWAPAQYDLGVIFRNIAVTKWQYSKAVKWLTKASLQGHLQAQYALGNMYRDGDGVKNDDVKALVLFDKAYIKIKEARPARTQLIKRMSAKDVKRARTMGLALITEPAEIKTFEESKAVTRNVKGKCGKAGKSLFQYANFLEENAASLKDCIGTNWNGNLCSGRLNTLKITYGQLIKVAETLEKDC